MNPTQQQEFDTAFKGLTPEEQKTYTTANPNINVGGVNQSFTGGSFQPVTSPVTSPVTTPITTPVGAMTADELNETTQPLNITNPAPTNAFTGVSGIIESGVNADIANEKARKEEEARQAEVNKKEEKMNTASQSLIDRLLGRKGEATLKSEEYAKVNELGTTVNQTADAVRKADQEILNEQYANRKRKEALLANGNLTREQANQQISEIDRQSVSKQADLYIKKLALQGDYDSAKSIADQSINARFEQQQNEIDAAQITFENSKEQFTKEEERLYNETWTKKQADLDKEKADAKRLSDTNIELIKSASEQGAPQSVIDAIARATTLEGKIQAAGLYTGDILDRKYKQAQLDKLNADNAKTIAETKALGVEGITNPEATKYSTALSTILGSGKFTKDQKVDVIRAVNNGEDPFSVIKNQAKNIMGQTLATQLDKYETAKSQMENISQLLNDFYANGGKTNIFTGNYEKTLNKLGEVDDPKLVSIATNISSALQIYRNAVSGTAYSVQEGKDIASIFPGINKSEGLNKAILSGRLNAFNTTIDAQYRNTLGKTYDDILNSAKKDTTTNDPLGLGISNTTSTSTNPLGI